MELERPDSPDFALLEEPLLPGAPETHLLDRLRKQTEFYLSDSNLLRDAHLARLLSKSKKQFLFFRDLVRFRRIAHWLRQAAVPVDQHFTTLARALKQSPVLILGRLRNMVRRKIRFSFHAENLAQLRQNKNDCTLYVEGFDRGLRHANIAEVFKQFGDIRSIALPLSSGKDEPYENLGYCFVEFATQRSLAECLLFDRNDRLKGHQNFKAPRSDIKILSKAEWQANQGELAQVTLSAQESHSAL